MGGWEGGCFDGWMGVGPMYVCMYMFVLHIRRYLFAVCFSFAFFLSLPISFYFALSLFIFQSLSLRSTSLYPYLYFPPFSPSISYPFFPPTLPPFPPFFITSKVMRICGSACNSACCTATSATVPAPTTCNLAAVRAPSAEFCNCHRKLNIYLHSAVLYMRVIGLCCKRC